MNAQENTFDISVNNLMVVLREIVGANQHDERLLPIGKVKIKLARSTDIDADMAWFQYLGDMSVRFVFDGPRDMRDATAEDLRRLKLSPDEALRVAVDNIEREYGKPTSEPWVGGVMIVHGRSPDLDSSYFLDRAFWDDALKEHPQGIVASVPKRGGLLFAPLSDAKAVDGLQKGVAYLHSSSGELRISSALYLFKDHRWTVFQAPSANLDGTITKRGQEGAP
ncbi:MAG TPA: hypothetical protein VKU61_04085 [Candidatus Binatia bacterium]|nr:hypothetical protein [Candidatus Binatia bacterium]